MRALAKLVRRDPGQMPVPLFELRTQTSRLRGELLEAIGSVLKSGQFILGSTVEEFERELAARLGARHVIGVGSGTDALELSLQALGAGPGDEVVTTPFTFFATAGTIARLGAKPVFVDIERDSFLMDPEKLEGAIGPRTRVALPVHLFGICADMDRIGEVCRKHGVPILEDAAQAIGATCKGRSAGTMGALGALSFFPTKNLGSLGDAGAVLTNDAQLAERVRALRVHGARRSYVHDEIGTNARLDAVQAAALMVKLRHLDEWNDARRANASRYAQAFAAAGFTKILKLPGELPGRTHVYHQYVIRAPERDELRKFLDSRGIGTGVYYPLPLHLQPCFDYLGYKEGAFPESEGAAREVLALPIYPEITPAQQEEVVSAIEYFYGGRGAPAAKAPVRL